MKKLNLSLLILLVSISIIGFVGCKDPEPAHEHTFSDSWSKDATYHWHAATCEHTTEVSGKAAHSFGDWTVTKEATCTEEGSKTGVCEVCKKEVIKKIDAKGHCYGEYVSNNDATTEADGTKTRECSVCGYEDTVTDEGSKIHVHTFATEWTYDGAYHWKAATCEHEEEVSEKSEHTFDGITCTECDYEIEGFVYVKAGTFKMGSTAGESDEKPVHEVTLTKNFYMSKYEVTQGEYEKYCSYGGSSPSDTYGDGDNYPAYYVSWYDALVYCNKRSINEGLTPCYIINEETDPTKWGTVPTSSDSTWNAVVCDWEADGYRLPTEAEWEYAARAGDNTVDTLIYSGTNDKNKLGEYAWYTSNSNSKTHEVGTKKANAFGLYDMSGNVWEWCWNWYTDSYDTTTDGGNDPTGALSGSKRVYRGGGWNGNSDFCAVSYRSLHYPIYRSYHLGFRVVRPAN